MFRAVVSLFLVVSMAFAFSGYLATFKIRQYQVRKEMKHLIKTGAPDSLKYDFYLDELEADPSNMTWIHSREFRFHGEMYDILDRQEVNGRMLLHCIHDVKESGLFAELDRMVNLQMNGSSQQQRHQNQLLKWFHNLYVSSQTNHFIAAAGVEQPQFPVYQLYLPERFVSLSTPPPELLV